MQPPQLLIDMRPKRSVDHKPLVRIKLVQAVCLIRQALAHRRPPLLARQVLVLRSFRVHGLLVEGTPLLGWELVVCRALGQARRMLVVATAASKDAATVGTEMVLAIVNWARVSYLRVLCAYEAVWVPVHVVVDDCWSFSCLCAFFDRLAETADPIFGGGMLSPESPHISQNDIKQNNGGTTMQTSTIQDSFQQVDRATPLTL